MGTTNKILLILLVLAILANPLTGWVCYEKGKTKGYSLASKDRATQTYAAREQNVENNFNYAATKTFAFLSWGRFHLLSIDGSVTKPEVTQKIVKEEEPKEAKK
ncbi:MAG: hypothetical protein WCY09_01575 [Candidatus Omnitrophota bacterium]